MNKTLLAYAGFAALCLVFLAATLIQGARLNTEREKSSREETAHNGTKRDYARDTALFLSSQRAANGTIAGLKQQLNATLSAKTTARAAEASRFAIFTKAQTKTASPSEVADEETNRASLEHINSAFRRASGL